MKRDTVKKTPNYIIDLTKIEGDGSFPCPKCGTIISPEDETEEFYKIIETKITNDELVELVVMCKDCGNIIKLSGFQPAIEGLTNQ